VAYVRGEEVPIKLVQDVLWCAAFLRKEQPCRGGGSKRVPVGCEGARVLLAPGKWDEAGDAARHALTFARVDARGVLVFDRDAIAAFVAGGQRSRLCPLSPARDPDRLAGAFADVPVRSLGWPLAAELDPRLRERLGEEGLEGEHGFVLKKGQPDMDAHAPLELRATRGGRLEVRPVHDAESRRRPSVGKHVRVPGGVEEVLREGVRLRGVRIEEGYVRLGEGDYEVEQRFVLTPRVRLGPLDRVDHFEGYAMSTTPRPTPEYEAWVERVLEGLRLEA